MPRGEGQVLVGRYRLTRLVGRGGMGEVWEALDLQSRRALAVKFLGGGSDGAPSTDLIARFQREIRVTAEISSRHIVGVHDAGHADGHLFMVMDLLDGEDVAQLARRLGPLPVALAARIAAQTCDGLAIAHAAGVVHRDIKPGNLFLARTGEPDARVIKILDFGIARVRPTRDDPGEVPTSITRTGMIVGSPAYMAPEQLRSSRTVDARVDVWALGVVLYKLLAGAVPHADHEDSLPELMFAICGTPAPPLRTRAPHVPAALAELVHRALAIDVDERLPSVRAFADGLARFAAPAAITEAMLVPNRTPEIAVRADTEVSDPRAEPLDATVAPASDTEPARASTPPSASLPVVVKIVQPSPAPPAPAKPRVRVRWTLVLLLVVVAVGGLVARHLLGRLHELDARQAPPDEPVVRPHVPRALDLRLPQAYAATDGAKWFTAAAPHCTPDEASSYLLAHPPKLSPDGTAFTAACLALAGDVERARVAIDSVEPEKRSEVSWPFYLVAVAIQRVEPTDARLIPIFRASEDYWPRGYFVAYHTGIAEFAAHDPRAREDLTKFLSLYPKRDGYSNAAERMLGDLTIPSKQCSKPLAIDPDGLSVFPASCSL